MWAGYCGCATFDGVTTPEEAKREVPCHGGYGLAWTCGTCKKIHHSSHLANGKWTLTDMPGKRKD